MKDFNKENLLVFLQQSFPNSDIKYLGQGWTSVAFEVDDKIVRFPREHPGKYIKESVVCNVLQNLIPFELPEITVVKDVEFPYSVHKKLIGRTWNMNYVHELPKDSQILLAEDCVKFLSQIHSLDTNKLNNQTKLKDVDLFYEEYGPRDFQEIESYLNKFFNKSEILSLAKQYDIAMKFETNDIVFCHNDFNGNNCILDKNNRLEGVFDWGNCGIGERTKDFMRLFFTDVDKEFFKLFASKYEAKTGVHIDTGRLNQLNMLETVNLVYWLNVQESLKSIKESDLESWIIPAISEFIVE